MLTMFVEFVCHAIIEKNTSRHQETLSLRRLNIPMLHSLIFYKVLTIFVKPYFGQNLVTNVHDSLPFV